MNQNRVLTQTLGARNCDVAEREIRSLAYPHLDVH